MLGQPLARATKDPGRRAFLVLSRANDNSRCTVESTV